MKIRPAKLAPAKAAAPEKAAPSKAAAPNAAREPKAAPAGAPKLFAEPPAPTSLSVSQIDALEKAAGRPLTVRELAERHPHARIGGKGLTLAELAGRQIFTGEGQPPASLGDATVDRNGDLDVSNLLRGELARRNPPLLLKKGDEHPVPLDYTLAHGTLWVRDEAQAAKLASAGFEKKDGKPRIDLSRPAEVDRALTALRIDPRDEAGIKAKLATQGVTVPLTADEAKRRLLLSALDSRRNEVDLHDSMVKGGAKNNADFPPTVYGSAKISPEEPGSVIYTYKRYNNASFVGQGGWVTKLLNKDDKSQHEFDSEAAFFKVDARSGELQSVIAARHYYGELYTKDELAKLERETGRKIPVVAVSFKAHGSRLAEDDGKELWAAEGEDGVVSRWDPREHLFKDVFMGLDDADGKGKDGAELIEAKGIHLVIESDDQHTIDLQTKLGASRQGLFGSRLFNIHNDGIALERFGGTDWFYEHEKLHERIDK